MSAYQPLHDKSEKTKESVNNARQGETPHRVRYVLAWSIFLIVVSFAIVYYLQPA